MVDWNPYLESLCNAYRQWWTFGTLKDVVEPKRFEFGLMVQTVERDSQQRSKEEQKIERLSVLEGLRKYAPNHVLLLGRPGSGKSTALVRLLVATAEQGLQNPQKLIPVLVQLRQYKPSGTQESGVLYLIQDFLETYGMFLELTDIKKLLFGKRFLLLVDGLNELPSDSAYADLKRFRQKYSGSRMVFTTRDLSLRGDLGIEKKFEMQSLKEAEVEKFVRECLPGGSQQTLQQLRQRLRQLGQTPFVMWILYFIVQKTGTVPSGGGSAFREFTQLYERRSKDDAPVSEESRRWRSRLLEHLGFEMMQAQKPTDLRLTISRREAEDILTKVLDSEKFDKPRDYALQWLEDLLKHHLIQVTSNDQIEFCHQLIQEYYAAEFLLKVLTSPPAPLLQGKGSKIPVPPFPGREGGLGGLGLSDDELKRDYLNYLKWTPALALMLELLEDEAQAVRVVKLALRVDWQLGARLAGAVKPDWQKQTVDLVAKLKVPQFIKIELVNLTKSEKAIPELVKALKDEDDYVRRTAAEALGNIGSDAAIEELVNALNHKYWDVRRSAAEALGNIGSDAAIEELCITLNDAHSDVRRSAAVALGNIGSDAAIEELVNALNDKYWKHSDVRRSAAVALGNIGSDAAIEALVHALNDADWELRSSAAEALGEIGSDVAIEGLVNALNDKSSYVRKIAAKALGKIGSDAAIPELVKDLNDEDYDVRIRAAEALVELGSDAAIQALVNALNHEDDDRRMIAAYDLAELGLDAAIPALVKVLNDALFDMNSRRDAVEALRKIGSDAAIEELVKVLNEGNVYSILPMYAAYALGEIGSDAAIPALVNALNHADDYLRGIAAEALGKIGSDTSIQDLLNALNYEYYYVRMYAAEALGKIGSDAAIPALVNALYDEDSKVRWNAAEALGKIGSDAAIPALVKALNHEDFFVRRGAVGSLGKIGSDAVIPELVKALNHEDFFVRRGAAYALAKLGSDAAIPELVKALNDEDFFVRRSAAKALGNIGSDAAIPELVKALNDQDWKVRQSASKALGNIGSDAAIPELVKALNDQDGDVRSSAAEALGKIGSDAAIE